MTKHLGSVSKKTCLQMCLVDFKGIYLSKALTCMLLSCINKNVFIKETDTFGHIVV